MVTLSVKIPTPEDLGLISGYRCPPMQTQGGNGDDTGVGPLHPHGRSRFTSV